MTWIGWMAGAWAGEITWETLGPQPELTCSDGKRAVGAGGGVLTFEGWLTAMIPVSASTWRVGGEIVPHVDTPHEVDDRSVILHLLCVPEDLASCLTEVRGTLPPADRPDGRLVLTCPADRFAISGGAAVVGEPHDVGIQVMGTAGMLAPNTYVVEARRHTPDDQFPGNTPWGIEATAWCAPAEVLGTLYRLPPDFTYQQPLGNDVGDWEELSYFNSRTNNGPGAASIGGAMDLGCDGFVNLIGEMNRWTVPTDRPTCDDDDSTYVSRFVSAGWTYDNFARALETCGEAPSGKENPFARFRIGATVMWGLDKGSDGFVWVPGSGPVPVDPQPFSQAFGASPVAVTHWSDPATRDRRIAELGSALDAERTPWSRTTNLADAARTSEVLVVTPKDEEAAVRWLAENRARLSTSRAAVLLFLEEDGPGANLIERW